MTTKAELIAELEQLGVEFDRSSTKAELAELLDVTDVIADEIDRREASAPKCKQCGRSRLDGHVHVGV